MLAVKHLSRMILRLLILAAGLAYYAVRGVSLPRVYQAFVVCFCLTRGMTNDILSWCLSKIKPFQPETIDTASSLFPNDSARHNDVLAQLESQGYCVLADRIPQRYIDRVLDFALKTECVARGDKARQPRIYGEVRDRPEFVRYEFDPSQLLATDIFNDLILDPFLIKIAGSYLRSAPIVDVLSMWWHTAFSKVPDADAAQFFHFDMDRIRWLKIFVYITDVGPQSGPHSFVAGSHKSKAIPRTLLDKGYARLSDEAVLTAYGPEFDRSQIKSFSAPRGTVILEDTRGLHKGNHVISGDRLMFQVQFSNCLFGSRYPSCSVPVSNHSLSHRMSEMGLDSFYGPAGV